MKVLVTGGAGLIGSAARRRLVAMEGWSVVKADTLTCTGELQDELD
jgi:nucleoside-diphosphate-sugar epimerase